MKKVFIALTAILALSSCTKDWTCKCKTTVTIGSTNTETKNSYTIKDRERGEAKELCQAANVTSNTITTKCRL